MEVSSEPPRSSIQEPDSPGDGADHISALPDEMLLLVLARLPCASAAARTGVLSRRWRGLWACLRKIFFRDVALPSLEEALGRVPRPPAAVSHLQICVPNPEEHLADSARVNSVLRAAARIDPENLAFILPADLIECSGLAVDLPQLDGTTSMVLHLCSRLSLRVPAGAQFPGLQALYLSDCITDIDALLSCCQRLSILHLCGDIFPNYDIIVNSPSLQELVVLREGTMTQHVNIVAPMLKQLTISFIVGFELNISILAPMVEKLSWNCYYGVPVFMFGVWSLKMLELQTAEGVSSLHIYVCADPAHFHNGPYKLTQEIEKHMVVVAFSVLKLHLISNGHAFGAFVFHVFGMNRIRTATQRLKVVLLRSADEGGCGPNCPCEFLNWRSQTISLPVLKEVEFNGFEGEDHEFDLLKLILGCAPKLRKMIVKLSEETSASNDGCAKIYNIFKAYSSVECDVFHSSGLMHGSQNCPST